MRFSHEIILMFITGNCESCLGAPEGSGCQRGIKKKPIIRRGAISHLTATYFGWRHILITYSWRLVALFLMSSILKAGEIKNKTLKSHYNKTCHLLFSPADHLFITTTVDLL